MAQQIALSTQPKKQLSVKEDKADLAKLKRNTEEARQFFEENNSRWNEFRSFVFRSTLTDDDITNLQDIQKPVLEFNILEPYISRLCGEFAKQEPQIEVSGSHDVPSPVDVQTINVVDGIMRVKFDEIRKNGDAREIFKDLMSGGFSVFEVYTDYENDMSFEQKFKICRVFDPTMTGFDPLARHVTKCDGQFSFSLHPQYTEDFKKEHKDIDLDGVSFSKNAGFSWSYKSQRNEKILLVCDYYEKRMTSVDIVKLSNNITLTKKQYKKMLKVYEEKHMLEVPPQIVNERTTETVTIWHIQFIENQIILEEETDFKFLPHVFVDGNSIWLREGKDSAVEQFTRPYLYHARDIQRLKNFAGQTLANELENLVQHKIMACEEGIPPQYKDAYEDFQHADVLVYKNFSDKMPGEQLPPPQAIQRTPIPPEVSNTFSLTDQMTQNILGSFDIQMGNLNASQLSGLAVQETVTQGNAVAMPYVEGYLQALNQVATIIVDLIPKYWKTPRTIPVMGADGKRSYMRINDQNNPQSVSMDYSENALQVNVQAGVNFTVQKTRALNQIISMMHASPLFAQFMNTEGLPILLDNLEIRGIDQLKLLADGFVKQMKQQQAKAAQQPNPAMLKMQTDMQKLQLEQQKLQQANQHYQQDSQLHAADIANDAQSNQNDKMKIMLDAAQSHQENVVQAEKAKSETFSKAVELALATADQGHRHSKDKAELAHKIISSTQQSQQETSNSV